MTKMTSAYANKLIKKLKEDKAYWRELENVRHKYVVAQGEKAIIPEYDFLEVHKTIAEIDDKIIKIKHQIYSYGHIMFEKSRRTVVAAFLRFICNMERKDFL